MDIAKQQSHLAGARDTAVQKLRDLTVAIAIAAAAGVGVIGWVSAATIPGITGTAGTAGQTGNAPTGISDQPSSHGGDLLGPSTAGSGQPGSGVAVSGGSR